jgi:hypothetical protein
MQHDEMRGTCATHDGNENLILDGRPEWKRPLGKQRNR